VGNYLKTHEQRRYYGFVDVRRLESGSFVTGDIAIVCGIPKKKRKLADGRVIEEAGVATLRGGVCVLNGDDVIYDAEKGRWSVISDEFVEPDSRKKLSEIYKEIDFTREAVHA
jgi:hypothetical protein